MRWSSFLSCSDKPQQFTVVLVQTVQKAVEFSQVQFVGRGRPCDHAAILVLFARNDWLDRSTCSASVLGGFWTYFLRENGTRILRSTLTFLPEEVATLVVDNSSGMREAGFAGTQHLVLCSRRLSAGWRKRRSLHSRCFSCCRVPLGFWTLFSRAPPI